MDEKDCLIFAFIKEHLLDLTSFKYDKEYVKRLRRDFFLVKCKGAIGSPTEKEIAERLVHFLKITYRLKSFEEFVQFIEHVPFLKKFIYEPEKFANCLKMYPNFLFFQKKNYQRSTR